MAFASTKYPNYIQDVYDIVRLIPRGRVSTYGAIADYLHLGASRMVGWALFNSFTNEYVPAHRVVNRKGELSGRHHFRPPQLMQELLEKEGVVVVDDTVRDFKELLWLPLLEIKDI